MEPGIPIQCTDDLPMEVEDPVPTFETARKIPGSASDQGLSSQHLQADADILVTEASGGAGGPSVFFGAQPSASTASSKPRDKITIEGQGCTIKAEGLGAALQPGGVFQLGGHNHLTIYRNQGSGDGSAFKFKKNKHPLTQSQAEPEYKHMDVVSSKLAGDWRRLGRYMGLDDATLDQLRQDYYVEGQHEVNYRMLLKWKQRCVAGSGHCTLAMLAQLLASGGRGDIADELRKG